MLQPLCQVAIYCNGKCNEFGISGSAIKFSSVLGQIILDNPLIPGALDVHLQNEDNDAYIIENFVGI